MKTSYRTAPLHLLGCIILSKKDTWRFNLFLLFGVWKIRDIMYTNIILLKLSITCTYFHMTQLIKSNLCMCFAFAKLYMSTVTITVPWILFDSNTEIESLCRKLFCINFLFLYCYDNVIPPSRLEESWNYNSVH